MLTLNGYYTEKVKWKVKIRQTLQHLSTHKAFRIPKNRPRARFFLIFARKMYQKRLLIHLKNLYVRKLDT